MTPPKTAKKLIIEIYKAPIFQSSIWLDKTGFSTRCRWIHEKSHWLLKYYNRLHYLFRFKGENWQISKTAKKFIIEIYKISIFQSCIWLGKTGFTTRCRWIHEKAHCLLKHCNRLHYWLRLKGKNWHCNWISKSMHFFRAWRCLTTISRICLALFNVSIISISRISLDIVDNSSNFPFSKHSIIKRKYHFEFHALFAW